MEARGNEVNTAYSLHFDPGVLSISPNTADTLGNPDVSAGAGAPAGTTVGVNANGIATGDIGVFENFNGAATMRATVAASGTRRITQFRFHIIGTLPVGGTAILFTDNIVSRLTANTDDHASEFTYQNGTVTAAANASISGRVTTPNGVGLRNATVVLTDSLGNRRSVTTSSFGYYQFDDVALAASYTLAVSSRQYRFAQRTVQVTGNLTDVDFVGLE